MFVNTIKKILSGLITMSDNIVPLLEQRAAVSMQRAWDGDGDGSPTQINPGIGPYTR